MKNILLLFFVLFCSHQAQEVDPYRLSHNVEPEFQFIHLDLDPDKEMYSGYTEIRINVKKDISEFRLHGKDFKLTKFELTQNKKQISADYEFQEYGFLKIKTEQMLPHGTYKMRFEFEGEINNKGEGIVKFTKDSLNYIFTQMEAIYARQFFPCFDEPNFKIPYQIEITAPEKHLVVSNTPDEEAIINGSTKTHLFKKTKPIPSYLIAFAVGPYETTDIPGLSIPGRIIVPKGYIQKSQYGKSVTAKILTSLEKYFGIPYPYEKLDFIAVANFNSGAMENPGLIVYRESYLVDSPKLSLVKKYYIASVIAHELAHMWFGNMVTLEWWNDTWLNEGFTTWLEAETMLKLFPELKPMNQMVRNFEYALRTDRTENTAPIARTIYGNENPKAAFDALSYSKSQVVLRMLENWIGSVAFQKGLKEYFKLYQWKNATSTDLIEIMSKASGKNVSKMLNDFINQPGIPVVTAHVEGNKLLLSQTRLKTVAVEKEYREEWLIPLSIKINDGEKTHLKNIVLDMPEKEFVFDKIDEIEWVHLKENFIGYFLADLPQKIIKKGILSKELNEAEIQDIFIDLKYGFYSGKVNPVDILGLIDGFKKTQERSLATALALNLNDIRTTYVEKTGSNIFTSYLDNTGIPLLNRLGIEADLSFSVSERNAQAYLIKSLHKNSDIVEKVSHLGRKYLENETISTPSYLPFLETLCYNYPKDTLYNLIKAKAISTTNSVEKYYLVRTLCSFPGKFIDMTLDFALKGDLEPNSRFNIPRNISNYTFIEKVNSGKKSSINIFKWMKENENFYLETLSEDVFSNLPRFIYDIEDLNNFENLFHEGSRSKSLQIQFDKKKSDVMNKIKLQELYLEDVKQYLTNFNNKISVAK